MQYKKVSKKGLSTRSISEPTGLVGPEGGNTSLSESLFYEQQLGRGYPKGKPAVSPWAKPKKSLGQNFLNNEETLAKIITAADLSITDQVVEIGPGHGVLTAELIKNAGKVTSVELDSELIPELKEKFKYAKNFQLMNQNALEFIPPKTPYKLVANIPYYITSPIINHFLREQLPESRPTVVVILVQKEVAEKICARNGSLSILAIQAHLFGTPGIIATVPRSHFTPAPKVDSAIIKITINKPIIEDAEIKKLFTIINVGFSHKRKKLISNLTQLANMTKEKLSEIFRKLGLDENIRAERLTINDWIKLSEYVT
ncbi:MAG: 16S rRNA (adenine(1518)-N(6)/adenine(1519)-N(6))-dimethyltransferase RsmA [Candidatus Gracilibacteria bacterium]|jgi:16S rRNA (adenine1518-N6/adenine1519-N6)-dimethyltransferase